MISKLARVVAATCASTLPAFHAVAGGRFVLAAWAAVLLAPMLAASGQQRTLVPPARPTIEIGDLVREFRGGDAERAVATFATWTESQVEQYASLPATMQDSVSRAALALLHIEAGRRTATLGRPRSDVRVLSGLLDEREPHLRFAVELMRSVSIEAAKGSDGRLSEFCQLWDKTVRALSGPDYRSDEAMKSLRLGRHAEYWMGPEITGGPVEVGVVEAGGPAPISTSHGRFSFRFSANAEKTYGEAVRIDPHLPEAHLRLGRIFYLLDRRSEAAREFSDALENASSRNDVFSGYLAALFSGRLYEDQGQMEAAAANYRKALEWHAGGQMASISLGRLLIASGRATEGWAVVRAMLENPWREKGEPQDPWYTYGGDTEQWDRPTNLARMRALVRE